MICPKSEQFGFQTLTVLNMYPIISTKTMKVHLSKMTSTKDRAEPEVLQPHHRVHLLRCEGLLLQLWKFYGESDACGARAGLWRKVIGDTVGFAVVRRGHHWFRAEIISSKISFYSYGCKQTIKQLLRPSTHHTLSKIIIMYQLFLIIVHIFKII